MSLCFVVTNLAVALGASLLPHWARTQEVDRSLSPIESRIPVGSTSLYVRVVGKGPSVIVLHGGPDFDHRYLVPDLDRLGDAFRLIYYDQRGR
jgi:proline iminopeptidase